MTVWWVILQNDGSMASITKECWQLKGMYGELY